jgi:thiamine kinase-like enzyme
MTAPSGPPAGFPFGATAQRLLWPALPAALRADIEQRLGGRVIEAASQGSGFTSGFASRLLLADGSRVFVKAVSESSNPLIFRSYQQEARVAAALPASVPAPRLRWTAEWADWQLLAFDDVEARNPRRPWVPGELGVVLRMLTRLAESMTPAPAGLPPLETTADIDHELSFWRRAASGELADEAVVPVEWRPDVPELAALESQWAQLAGGETASHFDVRDDNLLLTQSGDVLLCDWNWLMLTAPWVDVVGLLISVHGDGQDAEQLVATQPLTRGVDAVAIDAHLAGLAGFFAEKSAEPPFPGSPWVRPHQRWYRDAALRWLRVRLDR